MIRTSSLTLRQMEELEPGELVRLSFGARASLLIFLKRLDSGKSLFGVLQSDEFHSPLTWYETESHGSCLSYGKDWVLEEVHGNETACNLQYMDRDARLFLTERGVVMRFLPPKGGGYSFGAYQFSMSSLDLGDFIRPDAAPVSTWRIWESIDYMGMGAGPLFEMGVAD